MVDRISPSEAKERMDSDWAYLDVRSVPEFEAGHPFGAYNVPLLHMIGGEMEPNPDFMRVVEAVFPKDAKIVVGCRSGQRSLRAAELMLSAGYRDVADQRGGWAGARGPFGQLVEKGWESAGLPVAHTAEPGRSFHELAAKR